jgi:hypothetical protein
MISMEAEKVIERANNFFHPPPAPSFGALSGFLPTLPFSTM